MKLLEFSCRVPAVQARSTLIDHFRGAVSFHSNGMTPIRFAVTSLDDEGFDCEVAAVDQTLLESASDQLSIFSFRQREFESVEKFNAVMVVPTGIGAAYGGHAGDSTPVAHVLAKSCDTLILHPNVVNASDINEAPANSLYIEGSILSRLMMGTVGLRRVRSNRVLVVIDGDHDEMFTNATINSVNAARASYGLDCVDVVKMDPPVKLKTSSAKSGRATGTGKNISNLIEELAAREGTYDAVAIASVIEDADGQLNAYFESDGSLVNPWGGIEAMLTHTISIRFNVPTAHSPMMESKAVAAQDLGIVEPRMAAEAVSMTFLNCVLKGLHQSPRIVHGAFDFVNPEILTASDISCLIIPDGCVGLPTLAALEQGIKVVAVSENENLMKNDLERLPWKPGQLIKVRSYFEAAGVMNALHIGLSLDTLSRPLKSVGVSAAYWASSVRRKPA